MADTNLKDALLRWLSGDRGDRGKRVPPYVPQDRQLQGPEIEYYHPQPKDDRPLQGPMIENYFPQTRSERARVQPEPLEYWGGPQRPADERQERPFPQMPYYPEGSGVRDRDRDYRSAMPAKVQDIARGMGMRGKTSRLTDWLTVH